MANSNRERGDYLERSTKAALVVHGWQTIRAAGSLGAADLWAARAGVLLLISCKVDGAMSPAEREALRRAAWEAGGWPVLAYREQRGRVSLALVDGSPRPERWDQLPVPVTRARRMKPEVVDGHG